MALCLRRSLLRSIKHEKHATSPSVTQAFIFRHFSTDHLSFVEYFQPNEIEAAVSYPSLLAGIQHVVIGPVQISIPRHSYTILQYPNPWDPSKVLPALQSLEHIRSVTIDLFHVIGHDSTSPVNVSDNENRCPEEVLEKLGIGCTEASFATWVLPSLPKILITHFPTWKGLQACHPYRDDRAG